MVSMGSLVVKQMEIILSALEYCTTAYVGVASASELATSSADRVW